MRRIPSWIVVAGAAAFACGGAERDVGHAANSDETGGRGQQNSSGGAGGMGTIDGGEPGGSGGTGGIGTCCADGCVEPCRPGTSRSCGLYWAQDCKCDGSGWNGLRSRTAAAGACGVTEPAVISEKERVIVQGYPRTELQFCGQTGTCANGQTCFRLTRDLGLCDQAQPLGEATTCSSTSLGDAAPPNPRDECGCAGRTCASGQMCRVRELTCSCAPVLENVCVDSACTSPTDCGAGSVCRPASFIWGNNVAISPSDHSMSAGGAGRCLRVTCQSDADCADAPGGLCGLILREPNQAGESNLSSVVCFYKVDASQCPTGNGATSTGWGYTACGWTF